MLHREPQPDQRSFSLARDAILAGAGISIGATLYARYVEPRTLLVRSYELEVPSLPNTFDGVTLAFLSDFHAGGPGKNTQISRQAFDIVERIRPNLILLGGDYYDDGKRDGPDPDWFRLPAIAPTFAVLGNHDYKFGPEATAGIRETLSHSGITVLRNESIAVAVRDAAIGLIGVDDAYTGNADFDQASSQLDPEIRPRVLLTHAGLLVDSLQIGAVDLILSGHTHGGQVRFSPFQHTSPLDAFWWLDIILRKQLSQYRQGLFYVRGSLLYVANGIGMTTLGVRFLAPPEVTFFRLRPGSGNVDQPCDSPDRYVRSLKSVWLRDPDGL